MDFYKNRHAIYRLTYHLVVVTKYRHPCITKEMHERLRLITKGLFSDWNCTLLEMNGEQDHIHLLFETPPQVQLSKIVNSWKTVTSRAMRKEFEEHLSSFYWKPYFWSSSYMLFTTGGAPIDVIKKYIENQDK